MYELEIPNQRRDEPQPRIILLESQLKKHHFLHWTCPGPTVTFYVRNLLHLWACNKLIQIYFRNYKNMIQMDQKLISVMNLIRDLSG